MVSLMKNYFILFAAETHTHTRMKFDTFENIKYQTIALNGFNISALVRYLWNLYIRFRKHILWYFSTLVIFISNYHISPPLFPPFSTTRSIFHSAAIPLWRDQSREQDLELSISLQAVQLESRINVMKIPLVGYISPIVSTMSSYIYGPVQDCRNSRALAIELLQTCTKLLVCVTSNFNPKT